MKAQEIPALEIGGVAEEHASQAKGHPRVMIMELKRRAQELTTASQNGIDGVAVVVPVQHIMVT